MSGPTCIERAWEVYGLNPRAVQTMAADGVDISYHTSNQVDEYAAVPFDYVLTVCDHANEGCPVLLSSAQKLHHNFSDPAKTTGSEAEIMAHLQAVREQIKTDAQEFTQAEFASVLAQ